MGKRLFIFIILIQSLSLHAQNGFRFNPENVQLKWHYTFVAAHHPFMVFYQDAHFPSYELSFGKKCHGEEQWHKRYNYPENGIGILYLNTGNQILGSVYAVFYYIDFKIFTTSKISGNFNFSSGLSWHNRIFNTESNYKNLVISTHLNGTFNAELSLNYYPTEKVTIISGIDFAHTSNGLIKSPNLGINFPAVHAGIKYKFKTSEKANLSLKEIPFEKHNDVLLSITGGYKNIYDQGKFGICNISFDFGRHFNYKFRAGAGFDAYYDGSIAYNLSKIGKENNFGNKLNYDAFLSGYFKFGHITVITQPGVILHSNTAITDPFFQNIGFLYYINPRLFSKILLRSHAFTADFIEWGFAFKIGKIYQGFDFNN